MIFFVLPGLSFSSRALSGLAILAAAISKRIPDRKCGWQGDLDHPP